MRLFHRDKRSIAERLGGPEFAIPEPVIGEESGHDGLVQVAWVKNSMEGQMVSGLLESEGIDCLQLMGSKGNQIARPVALGERGNSPRRVMVRPEDADRARDLIESAPFEDDDAEGPEASDPDPG